MDPDTRAALSLPTGDLDADLAFFTDVVGLRLATIFPADAPRVAILEGHGLRLRLDRDSDAAPGHLRMEAERDERVVAPNGTVVDFVAATPAAPPDFAGVGLAVHRAADAEWGRGRAGMEYRDLIPGRLGGALIASQIRIPTGGPVPDYVHWHDVAFQLIYCRHGWVRVVYQDQGEPFVMEPGDAVLQPPGLRHRVLESGAGLEVVELTAPAEHPTHVEHGFDLPNERCDRGRTYGGQRFVHHRGAAAAVAGTGGFERRDLALGVATGEVLRAASAGARLELRPEAGLRFVFVLAGAATVAGRNVVVDDTFVAPADEPVVIDAQSAATELLYLRLNA